MDKIEIKGYKSIKDLELPLKSVNILIGANGSGKTNFLSFFEFGWYLRPIALSLSSVLYIMMEF